MTTLERDKKYLIQCYTTDDVVFSKGKGIYMYDENGKKYLDFAAGIAVCGLGCGIKCLTDSNHCRKEKTCQHKRQAWF